MTLKIFSKYFLAIFTVLLILCTIMSECNKVYYWELGGSLDEIANIEIVEIEDFYKNDLKIICETDENNYQELIKDVSGLKFEKYFGDPLKPYGKAIKITFKNGNYDLISQCEPRHCNKGEGMVESRITRLSCSSTEFQQLIEKWTTG